MDVPGALDLRDHHHVEPVADRGDQLGQVVEHPRALERVHARPELRLAELASRSPRGSAPRAPPPCDRPGWRPRGCPSRMSTCGAMSGALATIFSFEKSRKWIIREGLNGISRIGSGASIASGLKKSRGLRMAAAGIYAVSRIPRSMGETETRPIETDQADREASGARPVRPLPGGLRGGRRVQALAGEDRDRGGRPPVLPAHDEPPPAAHQRRVRGRVAAGAQRGGGAARLLAGARHVGGRRVRQGDRQPRHRGALAPGAGVPWRHAVRRVRGARGAGRRSRSRTAAW